MKKVKKIYGLCVLTIIIIMLSIFVISTAHASLIVDVKTNPAQSTGFPGGKVDLFFDFTVNNQSTESFDPNSVLDVIEGSGDIFDYYNSRTGKWHGLNGGGPGKVYVNGYSVPITFGITNFDFFPDQVVQIGETVNVLHRSLNLNPSFPFNTGDELWLCISYEILYDFDAKPSWVTMNYPANNWDPWTVKIVPVPSPSTILFLGSGIIGLAGFRRKFKK